MGKSRVNPTGSAINAAITTSIGKILRDKLASGTMNNDNILTHHIATAAANVAKSVVANRKTETSLGVPASIPKPAMAPPKTVAEVTAQTAGYKMLEKLQVSYLPPTYSKEQIMRLMTIFGHVMNLDLIMDPILKKFNV